MRMGRAGLALILGLLAAGTAWAHGGATGIVKERMDIMSDIGRQMKSVGKMLKSGSYNAAVVSAAGGTIAGHAGETLDALFPEGSLQAPTEARPEIWADWEKFQAYSEDLETAAQAMKDLADNGADRKAIAGAFGALGRTCKECHEAFRLKK